MKPSNEVQLGFLAVDRGFVNQRKLHEQICKWLDEAPETGFCDFLIRHGVLSVEHVRELRGEFQTVLPEVIENLDPFATQNWSQSNEAGKANSTTDKADGSRFQILKQYAKGGLGVVYLAHDSQLQRDVALKQIRSDRDRDSLSETKFLLEAEITGQLEHPGIVPVYALGTDRNGNPYYAMRFIRGQEFKKVIQQFHEVRQQKKTALDGVEFRQLLRRFLDVCNAVDYAHSRGILHRDLKPANVMIGNHGETLVVDWGLAKILSFEEDRVENVPAEENKPRRIRFSGTTADTMLGSFSGTVAYAPPEQLMGLIASLCPASDVYSLGAILFELLTNRIPLYGKPESLTQVVEWTRQREFGNARRLDPSVPKSLGMICQKAMTFEIRERYPTARDLAIDIERWLADERVIAFGEREPIGEKLGRLMRRYRRWTFPVAAAIVFSIIVSLFGVWQINKARIQELLAKNSAVQNKNDAINRISVARSAIDTLLVASTDTLGDFPAARDLQKRLLDVAANDYSKLTLSKSEDPELELERLRALVRVADIQMLQSDDGEAQENYRIAISELQTRSNNKFGNDQIALLWKVELAKTIGRFAFALDGIEGFSAESEKQFMLAISQLRSLAIANPESTEVHAALGRTLIRAVNSKLMISSPTESLQWIDEALASLERVDITQDNAIDLLRVQAGQSRAQVLSKLNRNGEAILAIDKVLDSVRERTKDRDSPRHWISTQADSYIFRAGIHRRMGNYSLALQDLLDALGSYQKLKRDWPDNIDYRALAALTATNVGLLLLDEDRPLEAKPYLESSRTDFSNLRIEYPRVERYGDGLGTALSGLGQAELRTNADAETPIALLTESVSQFGSLYLESESMLPTYLEKAAIGRGQLAQAFHRAGKTAQAREIYNESELLLQKLIDENEANADYHYAMAEVQWRRGMLEWEDENRVEANKLFASSLDRMQKLITSHPENAPYRYRIAELYLHSPEVSLSSVTEADSHLQIATEISPTNLKFMNLLAEAKARQGEYQLANNLLTEIFEKRGSRSAQDYGVLAILAIESGDREGAITNLSKARELVNVHQSYDPDINRWIGSLQRRVETLP